MRGNAMCGTREAVYLAWRTIARCAQGTRTGHDRGALVQGIGPLHRPEEAFDPRWPPGTRGGGGGKGAGPGEGGGADQGPDPGLGHPGHMCPTAYSRPLRGPARQT
jgi:hypothetical protein